MHRAIALFALCLIGWAAQAEIRLTTRADGRRVIYNVGSSGPSTDYTRLAKLRDRRSKYDSYIERYARQYRIDPVLVRAVIQVESNFDPNCVSHKGARGLMQLMPGTARQYGVRQIHDPEENIHGGVHFLSDLFARFGDDLRRVLAAYNAGAGAVDRFRGVPPYEETTTYVNRALTVYYGRPSGGAWTTFAPRPGTRLQGGMVTSRVAEPLAVLPGMRYLGAR